MYIHSTAHKPKVIVIVEDNEIKEIVKEGCPDIEVEIFDYDIEELDKVDSTIKRDGLGKEYKVIHFR